MWRRRLGPVTCLAAKEPSLEHLSCRFGRFQAVALLLRARRRWSRQIDFRDRRLHPLHCAAQVGNETLFRLMLNVYPAGVMCVSAGDSSFYRTNIVSYYDDVHHGCTPLYVAAERGYAALVPTMLDVMGEQSIDGIMAAPSTFLSAQASHLGASMRAAVQFGVRCNDARAFEAATVLLEAFPVVSAPAGRGSPNCIQSQAWYFDPENHLPRALYTAVEHNQLQMVQLLLRRFPEAVHGYGERYFDDDNDFDDDDRSREDRYRDDDNDDGGDDESRWVKTHYTPMVCAAQAGFVEVMAALLEHDPLMASMNLPGVDPEPDGKPKPVGDGMQEAMRRALESGQFGIVMLLLQHQPYLDHLTRNHQQPLSIRRDLDEDMMSLLRWHNINVEFNR